MTIMLGNLNRICPTKNTQRSKYGRMQETLLACSEIHGGTEENRQPAINDQSPTNT